MPNYAKINDSVRYPPILSADGTCHSCLERGVRRNRLTTGWPLGRLHSLTKSQSPSWRNGTAADRSILPNQYPALPQLRVVLARVFWLRERVIREIFFDRLSRASLIQKLYPQWRLGYSLHLFFPSPHAVQSRQKPKVVRLLYNN